MQLTDFDYHLPPERIAQEPVEPRDQARMLVYERASGLVRHRRVADLPAELRPGDLLVLNDTRVRPARLFGSRASGGRVEVFLAEPVAGASAAEGEVWRALLRPGRRMKLGEEINLGVLRARILGCEEAVHGGAPLWTLSLWDPLAPQRPVEELLEAHGLPPLPPYIRRAGAKAAQVERDRERYQTVYARANGAVAAPTAGLHFTSELFQRLAERGVARASLTLHVGLGTFLPLQARQLATQRLHAETYELPAECVQAMAATRAAGGRILAIGTTTVRTLESVLATHGELRPSRGTTEILLAPGHPFATFDALLTNFHLPQSSLLMLVAALVGRERVLELYRLAIAEGYRFYSYGDALLVLP